LALKIAPWVGRDREDRGITPTMIVTVGWMLILGIVAIAATIATVFV
jgi:preprotein translocase subunit Sec61beta